MYGGAKLNLKEIKCKIVAQGIVFLCLHLYFFSWTCLRAWLPPRLSRSSARPVAWAEDIVSCSQSCVLWSSLFSPSSARSCRMSICSFVSRSILMQGRSTALVSWIAVTRSFTMIWRSWRPTILAQYSALRPSAPWSWRSSARSESLSKATVARTWTSLWPCRRRRWTIVWCSMPTKSHVVIG